MRKLILRGQELKCIEAFPPGLLFDLAEAIDGDGGFKLLAAFRRVLYGIVLPEDHDRLTAMLHSTTDIVSFDDINEALGGLIAEQSSRPTERPSASPAGAAPTGGPSRVVSLSPATARAEPVSSKAGRSRVS